MFRAPAPQRRAESLDPSAAVVLRNDDAELRGTAAAAAHALSLCLQTSWRLVVGPRLCVRVSFDPTPLSSSSSVLSSRSVVRSRFGSRGREVNRVFSAVLGRVVTRKPPQLGVRCLFSQCAEQPRARAPACPCPGPGCDRAARARQGLLLASLFG